MIDSSELPRKRVKLSDESIKNHNDEANRIASFSYKIYQKLGKSGKPNPANEHTVLACILEECSNTKYRLVSLATGTRCFPQNVPHYHEDIVDCHAESLLKRAFKRYLLNILEKWIDQKSSNHIQVGEFYEEVLSNRRYTLFVSQTPCGCVSRWKGDCKPQSNDDDDNLRHFKEVGVNRKPGRGALCPKPGCIHKIAKWNLFGLQGARLAQITRRPISIDQLVLGDCESEQGRFESVIIEARLVPDPEQYRTIMDQLKWCDNGDHLPSIHFADQFRIAELIRTHSNSSREKKPAGSSIVAWAQVSQELTTDKAHSLPLHCEILAGGRLLGARKRSKVLQPNINSKSKPQSGLSSLCDLRLNQDIDYMVERFQKLCQKISDNKKHDYEKDWELVRSGVSIFKGWPTIA